MCCKCCQYCLESCYWHLIEKRFCYDESIALYEEPIKEEKNNNMMFDNMAFYDSVAVIAGRSVVTIDPLPTKVSDYETGRLNQEMNRSYPGENESYQEKEMPIVTQPTKRLHWRDDNLAALKTEYFSKSAPLIFEIKPPDEDLSKSDSNINEAEERNTREFLKLPKADISSEDVSSASETKARTSSLSEEPNVEHRRRSLLERRTSKSLYLKIDQHKELPIIRQNSMPKFYLDTPQSNQAESCILRSPSTALASPVKPSSSGFVFDLYSVVQLEKDRVNKCSSELPLQKEDRSSKLLHIKEKIKLRRVKSSLATTFPHVHHM